MRKSLESFVVMCLTGIALPGTAVAAGQGQPHSLPTSQALEEVRSKPLIPSLPVGWKIAACEPVPENLHLRPLTCLERQGALIWFHTKAPQTRDELDAFMSARDGVRESLVPPTFLKNQPTMPYALVGDVRRREGGQFALFIGGQRALGDSFTFVYNASSKEMFDRWLTDASVVFNQAFEKLRDVASLEARLAEEQSAQRPPATAQGSQRQGPTTETAPINGDSPTDLSPAKYNLLKNGMTYAEVVGILGFPGVITSVNGVDTEYKWARRGRFIYLTFANGRVVRGHYFTLE